jgi:hypothetical protein
MNNYKIYEIHDLSNHLIFEILKSSITREMFTNDHISKNYLYDYRSNPANLFYILEAGRYKQGSYFVVTDSDNNYIASAGWNQYNNDTALVLTRMLVHPDYRTQYIIGKEVLPIMIEETNNYKNVWITANNYNKSIYQWFDRAAKGKSTSIHNQWPSTYEKFKPIGQHVVNHTLQWVAQLDK